MTPGITKFNFYANASKCVPQDTTHYFSTCHIKQEIEITTRGNN